MQIVAKLVAGLVWSPVYSSMKWRVDVQVSSLSLVCISLTAPQSVAVCQQRVDVRGQARTKAGDETNRPVALAEIELRSGDKVRMSACLYARCVMSQMMDECNVAEDGPF